MYLHEDGEGFVQISEMVAEAINQPASHVVKDYYVTMMLREVMSRNGQLVFKGGTALSKCYGVINRFSEDIDLGIEEERATQGQRKKIKEAIKEAVGSLGLEIANLEETRSKRDFNRYEIPLPEDYSGSAVTNVLFVETAVMTPISPTSRRAVSSLIGDYLDEIGRADLVEKYALRPFEARVTSLERSLCDKVYAVCDYYMEGKDLEKPSRHIYDIHKLAQAVDLDESLLQLFAKVGLERRASSLNCPSAEEGVDVSRVLREISDSEAYRPGYANTTMRLLNAGEDVPYDVAIRSIDDVVRFLRAGVSR